MAKFPVKTTVDVVNPKDWNLRVIMAIEVYIPKNWKFKVETTEKSEELSIEYSNFV